MNTIKVAVVGVGNCFSALYQGIQYYKEHPVPEGDYIPGIMFADIGGYKPTDIEVVAAFDCDARKVGKHLNEAIFAQPNCARVFCTSVPEGPVVQMGNPLDGFSDYMLEQPEDRGFRLADKEPADIVQVLKDSGADILLNYCPVGSEKASKFYAQCCLDAGVAMVNCIPVFIASDPEWNQKFIEAGLPIIGDDMRSQFGASVMSQILQELAFNRGMKVDFHQQINIGGNTDFNNMMVQSRLESKKKSKENVIRSQNDLRGIELEKDSLFAGPSTFIPYLKDNKVAYFRLNLRGFGDNPVHFDAKLSVNDSDNSAGVVIDAIRYLKVARELGIVGALTGPSAQTQKTPPYQMMFEDSYRECKYLANREISPLMKKENVFKEN